MRTRLNAMQQAQQLLQEAFDFYSYYKANPYQHPPQDPAEISEYAANCEWLAQTLHPVYLQSVKEFFPNYDANRWTYNVVRQTPEYHPPPNIIPQLTPAEAAYHLQQVKAHVSQFDQV